MPAKKVIVNVTSDVACPWCWVGKRSIEVAAANVNARYPNAPFQLELHWLPFQLDPEMKTGTTANLLDHIAKILGNPRIREQWITHPEAIPMNSCCAAEGLPNIEFRYTMDRVRFSTYRAHALLTYTGPLQKNWPAQDRLKEAMLRMTHKEGKNLDSLDELVAAAKEAGIAATPQEVESILNDSEVKRLLDEELRKYRKLPQFNGVPHFSLPNGRSLSGGLPLKVFEAALTEVLEV
ncbi:putative DSBA thioredoxin [Leptomonas seymouri]|uniref:Putative DSBA thioredoxin n=1 Tax=Leptomonas seymouri TaxID=5684 RepID=A0A0N1PFM2_LEPSE|nr:putative DSBA thioredoxin [Leptomonas seymouri]|eukprot:KPI89051.1 putative DSBA thioredoxin [Leptomonas seymouri]